MKLHVEPTASDGAARRGGIRTSRGRIEVPAFMPVGTRGTVRALSTHELAGLAAPGGARVEVMLANTYHLMLRPGAATVAGLGGLHRFCGWDGHLLTDSGGYQVFSLRPRLHDEGAEFRSTYDGSVHLLTPESAVEIQELLGADIQMVLDVCAPLPAPREELALAVARSAAWAARARRAHRRGEDQALFGIVQGGTDLALRRESARRTVELDFDGYGIGGLSVGEAREEMLEALEATLAELPEDQPRYLMGVGDPISIVEAVRLGVDMFDCVLPTRLARHGTLLTDAGRLNIRRRELAGSDEPVDAGCGCVTCRRYPRGYLRHLVAVGEPSGATLCTVHNLTWMLHLLERVRGAVEEGTLDALRAGLDGPYGAMAPGGGPSGG